MKEKACKAVVRRSERDAFYDRKDLELIALQKGMKKSDIRRLNKKELCRVLKVKWKETFTTDQQVCTNFPCTKSFPNRLSKDELVLQVKKKIPSYSKSELQKKKVPELCAILKVPYYPCPVSSATSVVVSGKKSPSKKTGKGVVASQGTANRNCVLRSELPLLPQQIKVVEYLRDHRGILVYHTVGSGKTLTAIAISQCFLDAYPTKKVIIVTPASLIDNFKLQMTYYHNIKRQERYSFYSFQSFTKAKKEGKIPCKDVLLIIDEAHNLRTSPHKTENKETGVQTKVVTQCAEKAFRVVLLSATPVVNSPTDLIPLYNMMRESYEPKMVPTLPRGSKQRANARTVKYSLPKLIQYMKCKVSFFDAVDKRFYPSVKEHDIYLQMSPTFEKKYDRLINEKKGSLSNLAVKQFGDVNLAVFYNGYRRAVNTLESTASPKIQWVLKKINDLGKDEKMIIFSHFLDAGNLAIIKGMTASMREKSGYIRGSTPKKIRSEMVEKYNSNQMQVLFISKAGGEGLDLKGTSSIVILEPSWNRSLEQQVIGRGVRYKSHESLDVSKRNVDIYRLYLVKPTDMKLRNVDFRSEEEDIPIEFNPHVHSIDMLMRFLQLRKEQQLEKIRAMMVDGSIENAPCVE